jgi:hypothetical protein
MQASEWGGQQDQTIYQELTPVLAEEWLEKHHFAGQRRIHPERVEAYANDMRHGLFGPSDYHFAKLDEWEPMMNGRHRCKAVLESNCTVKARVHYIPISTKEDAGVVYSWYDVAGMRSQAEILSAMGTDIGRGLLSVTQNACTLLISGFEQVPAGSGLTVRSSSSLEVKRRVTEDWGSYAEAYLAVIVGYTQRMSQILRRQSVMSIGMVTMRHCPEKAAPFWAQLAANDVRPETPQHLLMNLFLDKKANAFLPYVWARMVAHAWNSYHDGKSIKQLRLGESIIRQPIVIKGTPYDGKKVKTYTYEGEQEEEAA